MRKVMRYLGLALLLVSGSVGAQSPYGWRGPERNGIYPETGLLKEWPKDGPKMLWETLEIGKGYSSPVIVGDRLYVTGMNEDETREVFYAFSLDGKMLYKTDYGKPWTDTYPETRTTPTIEDGKAYVISGSGEIVCLNTADGKEVWRVDGGTKFERMTGKWGTSECPLVFNNKVFYSPGGNKTTIVALDAQTGETIWESEPLGEHSTYVSPLLVMDRSVYRIIGMTGKSVYGVDPETGKITWTFKEWGRNAEDLAKGFESIATNTPLYNNCDIFVCNGYDMGSFLLRMSGGNEVKLVWRNNDLDTHHGGFVLVDGTIYGSNWINNGQGNWVAVDWKTGETKYETAWPGGAGKGSIISADGMLYMYDERRGMVALARPNPEKLDIVSQFRINKGSGPHWAHLVINNGVLYVRHGEMLRAYAIK